MDRFVSWLFAFGAFAVLCVVGPIIDADKVQADPRSETFEHTRALVDHTRALEANTRAMKDHTSAMQTLTRKLK